MLARNQNKVLTKSPFPIDLSIVLHGDAMLAVGVLADLPEEIN